MTTRKAKTGTFAGTLADNHRRIDADAWNNIYLVGDVHGCRKTFDRLLEKLTIAQDDLVVCVGDIVRKGPDSKGALDIVRGHDNILSVRGNNEQGLLEGTKSDPALSADDLDYLKSLPLALSWEETLVVHGGIDHRKPLDEHSATDVLNMRSLNDSGYERPYWFETRTERPRVFFGHTVLSEPFETSYAVGLDTGCVYGGQLTAYDWRQEQFVTAAPKTTYQSRSEDSIVTPKATEVSAE